MTPAPLPRPWQAQGQRATNRPVPLWPNCTQKEVSVKRGGTPPLIAPNVFGCPCKQCVVAISAGDPSHSVCIKRKVPRCCCASPARAIEARKQRNRKHMTWVCCLLQTQGAHDVSTAGVKKKKRGSKWYHKAAGRRGTSPLPRSWPWLCMGITCTQWGSGRPGYPGEPLCLPPSKLLPVPWPLSPHRNLCPLPHPTLSRAETALGLGSHSREMPRTCGTVQPAQPAPPPGAGGGRAHIWLFTRGKFMPQCSPLAASRQL